MCRTFSESSSGSYAGRMAPPGMPKTTSTPTCSSERTRLCAPVIVVLARLAARPTVPATSDGVTVLATTPCPFLLTMSAPCRRKKRPAPGPAGNPAGPLPANKKTPRPGRAHRGVARGPESDRAPPDYEQRAHAPTVLPGPAGVNRHPPSSRHAGWRSATWTHRRPAPEHRSVVGRPVERRSVADRSPGGRAHQARVLRQHAAGVLRRWRRPPGPPGGELILVDEQVEHAVRD